MWSKLYDYMEILLVNMMAGLVTWNIGSPPQATMWNCYGNKYKLTNKVGKDQT